MVNDLFKRASDTIKSLAEGDYSKVISRNPFKLTQHFRSESKVEAILDPTNLILLTTQFIEQKFVSDDELPRSLIAFFDLTNIYSLLFSSDNKSLIKMNLHKHAIYLVRKIEENLELFRGKDFLMK